ncbi:Hypothetical predicted protein [Lecanosticta acicola]|uniref:Uncharacterized protein n=1 Tax=Lecanosticta acicola TaxID=111012 RepID=A0AAI9EBX3_9PEZI|nr:Hypothetical predicted protein [Lecanosticta acicola]
MRRGIDGETSVRIRYGSPPPRSDEDATVFLTERRKIGPYRPRHTPPDACAAQDVALDKAEILAAAVEAAKVPRLARRDSGMNDDDKKDEDAEVRTHVSGSVDGRLEPDLEPQLLTDGKKITEAPFQSTASQGKWLDPTRPETGFEEVRLFKANSRAGIRWFEWTGEGRPEWALDEKIERRPIASSKRRKSSWLQNRTD